MMLTDQGIIKHAVDSGETLIEPFHDGQVQAAAYDLRVGFQGATISAKRVVDITTDGYLFLAPGEFAVVVVLEKLEIGPQIDPGYRGRLIVGLTKLTPKTVSLLHKDDLLSVECHRLEETVAEPYQGSCQDKMELGAQEIEFITEREGMAPSEMLKSLRSLSGNVGALTADVTALIGEFRALEWVTAVIVAIGMAVIVVG